MFASFTGSSDASVAAAFLARSGGDVEAAVRSFFELGGVPPAAAAAPPAPACWTTTATTSQFSFGTQGKSACTTMALCACARLSGVTASAIGVVSAATLDSIIRDGVAAYIANPLSANGSAPHMSFRECFGGTDAAASGAVAGAAFSTTLHVHSELNGTTSDAFAFLAATIAPLAKSRGISVGVVVTKPPESVAVVVAEDGTAIVLDSHPRSHLGAQYAHAVALGFATAAGAAHWLASIYPPIDLSDCDPGVNYLYNAYSAFALLPVAVVQPTTSPTVDLSTCASAPAT